MRHRRPSSILCWHDAAPLICALRPSPSPMHPSRLSRRHRLPTRRPAFLVWDRIGEAGSTICGVRPRRSRASSTSTIRRSRSIRSTRDQHWRDRDSGAGRRAQHAERRQRRRRLRPFLLQLRREHSDPCATGCARRLRRRSGRRERRTAGDPIVRAHAVESGSIRTRSASPDSAGASWRRRRRCSTRRSTRRTADPICSPASVRVRTSSA